MNPPWRWREWVPAGLTAAREAVRIPLESMSGQLDCLGITRLAQAGTGTFGWQVRLQRRGVRYAKYFADRSHGGLGEALGAAREWRDALMRRLAEDEGTRVCARSSRNSSGVVGVAKVVVAGPRGAAYCFWQATWCPSPGERRSIRFSVRRHGDQAAFRLAVEARRDGTGG